MGRLPQAQSTGRRWGLTLPADPSSSSPRAVLRLPHDLPVHPPCLQHLLPVILAAPDSTFAGRQFSQCEGPCCLPKPCHQASGAAGPFALHHRRDLLAHVGVPVGHFLPCPGAMPGEGLGAGPKPPTPSFHQILTAKGRGKKIIHRSFSKQSPFLCYLPFSGSAPSLPNKNS